MIHTPVSNTTLDFASCNQEKIQFIASVQSHGVFAAVSFPDFKIKLVSENFHQLVGGTEETAVSLIGKRLSEALNESLSQEIYSKLKAGVLRECQRYFFEWNQDHHYDVYLFTIDQNLIGVEIELIRTEDIRSHLTAASEEEQLRGFVRDVKNAETLEEVGRFACKTVRALTGLDRVMLYRFLQPSWHGEVFAEDRAIQTQSFMRHKFPASDIPQPARDLYLKNQVRFIYNSSEEGVPISPKINPYSQGAVDLSNSRLRAVSKIHLEYLKNMGVVTSFSIAVTVEGKLWGLIACHGSKRTYISHDVRSICETLSNVVAMTAPMLEQIRVQKEELKFRERFHQLFNRLKTDQEPLSALFRQMDSVNELFEAHGFALIGNNKVQVAGITPTQNDLKELYASFLKKKEDEGASLFSLVSLADLDEKWRAIAHVAAGALVIHLNDPDDSFFVVFKPELLVTVQWGGDPRKSVSNRNYTGQINPRTSFESWTEEVKCTSSEWRDCDEAGIQDMKDFVFDGLIAKQRLISELTSRKT